MMDIDNKKMAILIVLALIVTIGGTWLILDKVDSTSSITSGPSTSNAASEITLTVNEKNNRESQISGQILLNIN